MTWEDYRNIADAIKEKQKEYREEGKRNPAYKLMYEHMNSGLSIALNLIGEQYVKGVTE